MFYLRNLSENVTSKPTYSIYLLTLPKTDLLIPPAVVAFLGWVRSSEHVMQSREELTLHFSSTGHDPPLGTKQTHLPLLLIRRSVRSLHLSTHDFRFACDLDRRALFELDGQRCLLAGLWDRRHECERFFSMYHRRARRLNDCFLRTTQVGLDQLRQHVRFDSLSASCLEPELNSLPGSMAA